uniref:Uncharacterized protein n=1 Tax=Tanacetum cinerariifolium TaxID=118510 RepID=A0A6L2J5X8_TANCI|nr:hypothetical protein [Tanacetum cinerariifolium]
MAKNPAPFTHAKQVGFNLEDVILNTNNEVALLYPKHSNKEVFLCVFDFIFKCCIREAFTRSPIQYKEYLYEFWYSVNALDNSKVSFSIPTGGIYGVLGVNTFRKAIGTHYLSHSSDYVDPPFINIVRPWFLTIGYGEEVSAKGALKKILLPPRPPFANHMIVICNAEKHVAFKAPKPSSNAETVPQGTKPGTKPRHKKHSTSKQHPMSSSEVTKGGSSKAPTGSKTGHLKRKKESSSAMGSYPSQPLVSTPVDTGMHKEDQQATGGPTSFGVTNEARANPQLNSDTSTFNLNMPIYSASFIIHTESASKNDASAVLDSVSSKARDQSVPSAGQAGTMSAEGEKNTNHREHIKKDNDKKAMSSKDAKEVSTKSDSDDETIHVLSSMVKYSKKKELKKFYLFTESGEHVHLTEEHISAHKKIEEEAKAEMPDIKGLITLKVYREDDTSKIILEFKASDLHLDEWREVVTACPNKKGKGWTSIYKQIQERMDYLRTTEAELGIDLDRPLCEQDPLDRLNDLENKKRKHADDTYDFSELIKGSRLDDHARTISSLLLADIDKRNLNPLKQMRVIKQLRQGRFLGSVPEPFSLSVDLNINSLSVSQAEVFLFESLKFLQRQLFRTINPTVAQQSALDNALVAPSDRVKIGKCNMRITPYKKPQKEPTYQVVLDALALCPCFPAFLITTDVLEIYMQHFLFTISKIKDSSSYQFKLDKKRCRIDVEVFRDILQICPRLLNQEFDEPSSDDEIEDFMFQINNRDSSVIRQENMPYPIFTMAIIQHFISKDKSIAMMNRMFMHTVKDDSVLSTLKFIAKSDDNEVYRAVIPTVMINQKIQNSNSYKTYLAFATGEATPKKARKWKKPTSLLKKQTLVITKEPAKKPTSRRQPTDDEEETQEDEFVHTHDDYVPTDDETHDVDDEEYDRINEEMYDDVNVDLKYVDLVDERKEIEIISMLDVQVQHEILSIQTSPLLTIHVIVILEPSVIKSSVIITAALATTIPPILPPFFSTLQQSTPIPTPTTTEATTSTTTIPESTTLPDIRVFDLEKEVKIFKNKSFVDIRKIKMEQAGKQQETKYTTTSFDKAALKKFDQKRTLFKIMTKSKSFVKNTKHMALYHALMKLILKDEDTMDKGITDKLKKRKSDDADRDEDPPVGPDQGLKRRKMSKDAEPSKKNLGEDIGRIDEPPIVKDDPKDRFKKPKRPPTPDPEWNTCKTVNDGPTQNCLSDLAKAEKPSKTFNDLMSTPIDFTAFAMNHLQISDLTKAYLGIEDMVPMLWIPVKVTYDRHALLERNRLMCTYELYKFGDGTLISVRDKLKDMAYNLELRYSNVLPRRRWSNLDKKRSHIMVKDIDRQLLERSLEKFVGEREYEEDLRVLQRTI